MFGRLRVLHKRGLIFRIAWTNPNNRSFLKRPNCIIKWLILWFFFLNVIFFVIAEPIIQLMSTINKQVKSRSTILMTLQTKVLKFKEYFFPSISVLGYLVTEPTKATYFSLFWFGFCKSWVQFQLQNPTREHLYSPIWNNQPNVHPKF